MAATRPLTTHEMLVALAAMEPTAFYWSTDGELNVQHISGGAVALLLPEIAVNAADHLSAALAQLPLEPGTPLLTAHRRALEGDCSSCDFRWLGWRFRGHVVPQYDDASRLIGCLGLAHQVADWETLESALEESERRFEALVQLSPVGICLTDGEGNFRYVNQRWCEMAGLTPAEAVGRGWEAAIHPDDRASVVGRWPASIADTDRMEIEYRLQTPTGSLTWVLEQAKALYERDGQFSGFLGVVVDITQRKLAARRMHLILNSAPEAIVIVDSEGQIVLANEQAERLFGYPSAELLHQPLRSFIPEYGPAPPIEDRSGDLLESGEWTIDRRELTGRRSNGSQFPAEISVSPIEAEDEVLFAAVVRDITRRKQAEAALWVNLEVQSTLTALLALALEPASLRQKMERTLDILFAVPWIELQSKGAIFMVDGDAGGLSLLAQRGLPDEMVRKCSTISYGHCLCGQAFTSDEIAVEDCTSRGQAVCHQGLPPHGHYSVPITSGRTVFGVMNLFVAHEHHTTDDDRMFLQAVANVLAGMIVHSRAEDSLRASEERFELAVRGSDAGIWDWNLINNQVYFSPRWKSILGCERDEIMDDFSAWESRLHPDDRDRAMSTIRNYLDGNLPEYELEHRLQHRDGTYRWILARGAMVRDGTGKPYRMVGSHLDITQRKEFEERLRQREAQLIAAQRIQEFILPRDAPNIAGFDIAGRVVPAEFAGGDYFDFLKLPDGSLGVVIGDVSGHDVSASLVMATTSAHLRSFADDYNDVEEILTHTNSILSRETDDARFVTLFFLVLDPPARRVNYVNAGHPSGYIVGSSGELRHELRSGAFPLSVMPDATYPLSDPIDLVSGDVILLLTDGVLEARAPNGELFDRNRLFALVHEQRDETASAMIQGVVDMVQDFTQSKRAQDDLTIVIVKVCEAG